MSGGGIVRLKETHSRGEAERLKQPSDFLEAVGMEAMGTERDLVWKRGLGKTHLRQKNMCL